MNTSANIIQFRVNEAEFKVNPDKGILQVQTQIQFNLGEPVDENDKTVLIKSVTAITAPNRDDFLIRIEADTVLEFNTVPQDYKTLFEKTCIPIVSQRLFDMVDNVMKNMGRAPLFQSAQPEGSGN